MQAPSKTIFITGAAGFIGRCLAALLLEQGHHVKVLVRPENKPDSRVPKACEQLPAELTDTDQLIPVLTGSSAVIYCAGSVRGRSLEDFAAANINGVSAVIKALEQIDNTSDCAPSLLLLSSLAASRPALSDYAYSKNEGEKLLHGKTTIPWTILRPPAVYGPGDQEMLPLLRMIRRGLLPQVGPTAQRLSLLHVDDLSSAIVSCLSAPKKCLHKTFTIDDGTPGGYTWQAIGEAVSDGKFRKLRVPQVLLEMTARANFMLSSILGYQPMLTPGKVRELTQEAWLCDNKEITLATGWTPQINLRQGAKQLFQ